MNKKYLLALLGFVTVLMLSFCLASCGSNDDDEEGNGTNTITSSSLVGKWRIVESNSSSFVGVIYTYNSDGTWECSKKMYEVYTNWDISEGKLIMTRENGRKEIYSAYIKDNRLFLYFGDVRIRDGEVIDASESKVLERVSNAS